MRANSAGDAALAARVADAMSGSPSEYNIRVNIAMACLAVVAIDDTPIFEVFGVDIPPTLSVDDPYMPPLQVRVQAFFQLYDWVMNDTRGGLGNRIWDIYNTEMDKKSFVSSYLDNRNKNIVMFSCPVQDCEFELAIVPEHDATGNIKPVFCQHHGVPMLPDTEVNPEQTGGDIPLS